MNSHNVTRVHFYRCAMESIALGLFYGYEKINGLIHNSNFIENFSGIPEIRIVGGGSKNDLLRQICADVFGVAVVPLEQK